MDLELEGKVAIITGASRGIGRGIANGLAAEGCHVVICARHENSLHEAATELRGHNVDVLALKKDVGQADQATSLVEEAVQKFGHVDILVNNVGGNRRTEFESSTDEDWQDILNLNLMSHVRVSRAVIPHMKKIENGSIIFIASVFGRECGGKTLSIYNTTKSGIISLAKTMATELSCDNIRVNSIAPGSIRFPGGSWDKRCNQDPEGMKEFVKREIPLGRFGTVEEVANVAAFLSSAKASLVTGACISVDGCQSRSLI